jgi:uncharacterized membrane protein
MNITETQRLDALERAQELMDMLEPVFIKGDIDEEQFKHATSLYTQALIMRARLTSLEGRTQ